MTSKRLSFTANDSDTTANTDHAQVRSHRGAPIRFFTIAEVAELVGVAPRTVRRWIDDKKLVAHRFGAAVRIAESDLRAFIGLHRDF